MVGVGPLLFLIRKTEKPKGEWQFIKHRNVGVTIHNFTIDLDKHNGKYVAVHLQWAAKGA